MSEATPQEKQTALTPAEIQAWREACVPLFEKVASALYLRAKQFYAIPKPDKVRPLMSQGIAHALDQLFDAAAYPNGMTAEAVMHDAAPRIEAAMITYFAPHQDTMLLHGKRNYRNGKPANSMSWEDIDRTMCMHSHHFAEQLHAAGKEVGVALGAYQESDCGLHSTSVFTARDGLRRILQADPNILPDLPRR
jgi:hypothetical protein